MSIIKELNKICKITLSLISTNPRPQDLIQVGQYLRIEGSIITSEAPSSGNGGWNELHLAAYNDNIEAVEALKDGDINKGNNYGWTPMHLAAQQGHIKVMRVLLATQKMDPKNCGNNAGFTPLHVAAWSGHTDIINMLNAYGFDNNTESNKGWNALHCAVWNNQLKAVNWLIIKKVDISKGTKDGVRPLHIAASLENPAMAKLLLEHNANLSGKTKTDVTPLHIAVFLGHLEMTTLLTPNGKKISDKILGNVTAFHIAVFQDHLTILQYLVHKFPHALALLQLKQDTPLSPNIKAIIDLDVASAAAAVGPQKSASSTQEDIFFPGDSRGLSERDPLGEWDLLLGEEAAPHS